MGNRRSDSSWFNEHVGQLIVGLLTAAVLAIAGAALYVVTTTYKSEQRLTAQAEQLNKIQAELATVKKSFIAFLIEKTPNKSNLIQGLVGDARTAKGIDSFREGNIEGAYAAWTPAAKEGNQASMFAIAAANSAIEEQLKDPNLPDAERAKLEATLAVAPDVYYKDGELEMKPSPVNR